jgi:hypothetical protein
MQLNWVHHCSIWRWLVPLISKKLTNFGHVNGLVLYRISLIFRILRAAYPVPPQYNVFSSATQSASALLLIFHLSNKTSPFGWSRYTRLKEPENRWISFNGSLLTDLLKGHRYEISLLGWSLLIRSGIGPQYRKSVNWAAFTKLFFRETVISGCVIMWSHLVFMEVPPRDISPQLTPAYLVSIIPFLSAWENRKKFAIVLSIRCHLDLLNNPVILWEDLRGMNYCIALMAKADNLLSPQNAMTVVSRLNQKIVWQICFCWWLPGQHLSAPLMKCLLFSSNSTASKFEGW